MAYVHIKENLLTTVQHFLEGETLLIVTYSGPFS